MAPGRSWRSFRAAPACCAGSSRAAGSRWRLRRRGPILLSTTMCPKRRRDMTLPEQPHAAALARERPGPDGSALGIEAQLWREISQHLELEESLRRVAPLLRAVLPIDAVLIRRIEREPLRLTTVAAASCDPSQALELRV